MNPELLRNLWLELTPQRVVAMPVILGLVLAGGWLSTSDPATLSNLATSGFVLMTVLWGGSQVSSSLQDEFAQGTWDAQRASGLSAGQMVLGKLLGGGSFAWYGGAWCLAVYAAATWYTDDRPLIGHNVLGLLALALIVQALALLTTLMSWRKSRTVRVRQSRGGAIVLGLVLLMLVTSWIGDLRRLESDVHWYLWMIPAADFVVGSLLAFAAWALVGAHRAMRMELKFHSRPWAWLAFMTFLILYCGGWIHADDGEIRPLRSATPLILHLTLGAGIAATATYAFLFYERKDTVQFQRLAELWRGGRYERLLTLLPLWPLNFALAVLMVVATGAASLAQASLLDAIAMIAGTGAVVLFLVRDIAIVLWCNLGAPSRRADTAAVAYLLTLYVALPFLVAAAAGPALLGAFLPYPAFDQPVWLLSPLVQATAALDLVLRRWRKLRRSESP